MPIISSYLTMLLTWGGRYHFHEKPSTLRILGTHFEKRFAHNLYRKQLSDVVHYGYYSDTCTTPRPNYGSIF